MRTSKWPCIKEIVPHAWTLLHLRRIEAKCYISWLVRCAGPRQLSISLHCANSLIVIRYCILKTIFQVHCIRQISILIWNTRRWRIHNRMHCELRHNLHKQHWNLVHMQVQTIPTDWSVVRLATRMHGQEAQRESAEDSLSTKLSYTCWDGHTVYKQI